MEILILGGGVTGISTAYQLLKDGHKVIVVDRNHPGTGGASFGNAGLIAVGHFQNLLHLYQDDVYRLQ